MIHDCRFHFHASPPFLIAADFSMPLPVFTPPRLFSFHFHAFGLFSFSSLRCRFHFRYCHFADYFRRFSPPALSFSIFSLRHYAIFAGLIFGFLSPISFLRLAFHTDSLRYCAPAAAGDVFARRRCH